MTWEKEEMKRAWRPVMLVDVWPVESLELPSNQLNRTWSTEFSFVFHRALNKTNRATWFDSLSFSVLWLLVTSEVDELCFVLFVPHDNCMNGVMFPCEHPKELVTHKWWTIVYLRKKINSSSKLFLFVCVIDLVVEGGPFLTCLDPLKHVRMKHQSVTGKGPHRFHWHFQWLFYGWNLPVFLMLACSRKAVRKIKYLKMII